MRQVILYAERTLKARTLNGKIMPDVFNLLFKRHKRRGSDGISHHGGKGLHDADDFIAVMNQRKHGDALQRVENEMRIDLALQRMESRLLALDLRQIFFLDQPLHFPRGLLQAARKLADFIVFRVSERNVKIALSHPPGGGYLRKNPSRKEIGKPLVDKIDQPHQQPEAAEEPGERGDHRPRQLKRSDVTYNVHIQGFYTAFHGVANAGERFTAQ